MQKDAEKGPINEGTSKNDFDIPKVSRFRRILPQVLASSAKNLILLDLGMTMAFPTLVISALLKAEGRISFDDQLASWFGSIAFICQPIGSVISGTVLEPLGRKKSMLLVNIPHLIGWYLFYTAVSVPMLFLATIMMGLGAGFMEAPVITYVGEISEPNIRGILTSYTGLFVTIGLIVEFTLGTVYHWTIAAFISSFVPILTIIAISQVPETPMWLLSKGRVKEAEKSLCWLRGWVPASHVQKELHELTRYSNASKLILKEKKPKNCADKDKAAYTNPISIDDETSNTDRAKGSYGTNMVICAGNGRIEIEDSTVTPSDLTTSSPTMGVERKATLLELIQDMMRPEIMKPFVMVIAVFFFNNNTGFPAMRPYMVNVFEELKFPIDAHWATVVVSTIGFVGVVICTVSVKYTGKRILALISLAGCAISLLGMSIWTLMNDNSDENVHSWTPFVLFTLLSFSYSFGIGPVPWIILSEVFPFRGRGFASGCAAALTYMMGFFTSKTFLDFKRILGLSGVCSLYGFLTALGIMYVYFKLPETEGKSLEDIENYYKTKLKKKTSMKS